MRGVRVAVHVDQRGAREAEARAMLPTIDRPPASPRGRNQVGSDDEALAEKSRVAHEDFVVRSVNHLFVRNVEQQRRSLHAERAAAHLHAQLAIGLVPRRQRGACKRENHVALRVQHHDALVFHPQSEVRRAWTPLHAQNRVVRVEVRQIHLGVLPNVDRGEQIRGKPVAVALYLVNINGETRRSDGEERQAWTDRNEPDSILHVLVELNDPRGKPRGGQNFEKKTCAIADGKDKDAKLGNRSHTNGISLLKRVAFGKQGFGDKSVEWASQDISIPVQFGYAPTIEYYIYFVR